MTDNIYGPQTLQIEALISVIGSLDADQVEALNASRAARDTAFISAWAALDTIWDAPRDAASDATVDASSDAWDAASDTTWAVLWDTVLALVVHDLIGGDKFTQNHYDVLTTPWRTIIGPIHPDDIDLHINKGE